MTDMSNNSKQFHNLFDNLESSVGDIDDCAYRISNLELHA